ncbi:cytochrome P450 71D8 [Arachis hypogaea]|uniref:Cytochrome P450 n=1 Tax=Arachis hypogaea TaxID=3818 RepID=A0A445DJ97_ARAHY|nr:cytochrome P450 71D8 [Arachis hypogaea]QHO37461.1 Cytochrome P450 [Arachis hypogaea]RYR63275.1 hypothetical protein Ahy_A04g021074 [Arachis hypogaea]
MEIQFSYVIIISIVFATTLWLTKNLKQNSHTQKLPPGPWKLPLIGNLHQLASAGSLPHHALQNLSLKYGPIMHLKLGQVSAVVVSSSDVAKEIMKTHDHAFLQRPEFHSVAIFTYGSKDVAFAPYGDYWRQIRKMCTLELLSSKRVQSFAFIREQEVCNLIESIHSCVGSEVNVSEKVFSMVSTTVSRATFGNKTKDHEEFVGVVKEVAKMTGGFDLVDLFPCLKVVTMDKAKMELQKKQDLILENIIREHKVNLKMRSKDGMVVGEKRHENLIDVLLRIQQSGDLQVPLTDDSIKAIIWDMFAAGTDTSSTVLEWTMMELMRNPSAMKKLQAEIRGRETLLREHDVEELVYLKSVIKEALRLHAPVPLLLPRECTEATKVKGYDIPKKAKVIVNAWAIGRDPKHWDDALSFKPERFHGSCVDFRGSNFEYIPFGAGRRMCPGISFGLSNVEYALAKLLYHFNWQVPKGIKAQDLDVSETFGSVSGIKNNLFLVPTPYIS